MTLADEDAQTSSHTCVTAAVYSHMIALVPKTTWNMYTCITHTFLALLDSVSRAHGMGLQHVVRLASGVRRLRSQLVAQLSQNLLNAFLSNFSSRLPWG